MLSLFAKIRNNAPGRKDDKTLAKLPRSSTPSHYRVCIKPTVFDLSYEASIAIDIMIKENAKQIVLNALDLNITKSIWEEDVTNYRQEPFDVKTSPTISSHLEVKFEPLLLPQNGQLRMNFKGSISEKRMMGLCRLKSCTEHGDPYNLITHFEPSDARRVFPCYDDPSNKAFFDISLIVPKGKAVMGNMPIKARYDHKKNKQLEIVEFKRTPPMSPHAIGFTIGSFSSIHGRSSDDEVGIGIHTALLKQEQGRYALEVARKALAFLATFLNSQFPLEKLDFVAVPDYATHIQECWGLLMYPEAQLLVDPGPECAASDKQYVSLFICQGVVTQWFGLLVTFQWWDQLWLKEGLSTFLRYVCLEDVQPEFEASTHFVTEVVHHALRADALKSTHPLEFQVSSSIEAEELYDDIAYKKGASLIRMLYNYIGEDHFKDGLNMFLSKYKFKNATDQELWKCFEEISGKPVGNMMNSWTKHRGYPMIKISTRQDGLNKIVKLSQEKFTLDAHAHIVGGEASWVIPLTITSEKDAKSVIFHTTFENKFTTYIIPDCGKNTWIKVNPGVVGFYRVRYKQALCIVLLHLQLTVYIEREMRRYVQPEMFTSLVLAIRDKKLEPVDRINVLDDMFAFFLSGVGSTIDILTLTEAFIEDEDYDVWCAVSFVFDKFLKVLAYINLEDSVRKFGIYLFGRVLDKVGYKTLAQEHHHTTLLRSLVLRMMVKFRNPHVLSFCRTTYEDSLKYEKKTAIPADVKYAVYCGVLCKDDDELLRTFMKMYRKTDSVQEKDKIANAFGSISDSVLIKKVLEFATMEDVRKADAAHIFASVAAKSRNGRIISYNFFKENASFFKNRYGSHMVSILIKDICEDFASEENALDVLEFFKTSPFPGTERAVLVAVESIRANEAWLKREKNPNALKDYLEADAL